MKKKPEMKLKVIAFWSYKGGTGRSLACANTAYTLARMGKNVAVLDADIDAPGILYKFLENDPEKRKNIWEKEGWIELLWSKIKGKKDGSKKKSITSISSIINLKNQTGKIGKIHFIPSGNIQSEDYWKIIGKHRIWNTFLLLSDQEQEKLQVSKKFLELIEKTENPDLISKANKICEESPEILTSEEKKNIYIEVLDEIENDLDPKPDYLLVDLRSGNNEIQEVITKLWVDKMVTIFTPNEEQVYQFENEEYPLFLNYEFKVVPVMTRFQPTLFQYVQETVERLMKKFNWTEGYLCKIHEDRHLELFDDIALMAKKTDIHPLIYKQIRDDYIDLVSNILNEEQISSDRWLPEKNKIEEQIRKDLDINKESIPVQAALFINYITGELVNEGDNSRNISFRVDTFDSLLSFFREFLKKSLPFIKPEIIESSFKWTLETAGMESGRRFGRTLMKLWKDEKKKLSETEKIKYWCDFDSKVGWGTFIFEIKTNKDKINEIVIVNKRNPFASGRTEKDVDLCPFLSGYIKGVIIEILNMKEDSIIIKHDINDCIRGRKKDVDKGCIFTINFSDQ
ncbi:P-loop NTPase [Candidatus Sumerlaeota bacterium]|nr:P-loop NTPase [Candidatus Sumerlaeota bacterium]